MAQEESKKYYKLIKYREEPDNVPVFEQIWWSKNIFENDGNIKNDACLTATIDNNTYDITEIAGQQEQPVNITIGSDRYFHIHNGDTSVDYWPEIIDEEAAPVPTPEPVPAPAPAQVPKLNEVKLKEKAKETITKLEAIRTKISQHKNPQQTGGARKEKERQGLIDLDPQLVLYGDFAETIRLTLTMPILFKINSLTAERFKSGYVKFLLDPETNKTSILAFLYENISQYNNIDFINKITKKVSESIKNKDNANYRVAADITADDTSFMHIMRIIERLETLINNRTEWDTIKEKLAFENLLHALIDKKTEELSSALDIVIELEKTENERFRNALNSLIREQNNKKILTYVKLSKFTEYLNQRFKVKINSPEIPEEETNTLTMEYNDDTYPYYTKQGNDFLPSSQAQDIAKTDKTQFDIDSSNRFLENIKYKQKYLLGKFNKIFLPNELNTNIAEKLYEEFYSNPNADKGYSPLILLGYGSSGSGKTSSLIYLSDEVVPVENESDREGIVIKLCNLLGEKTYSTIEVFSEEYYKNYNDQSPFIKKENYGGDHNTPYKFIYLPQSKSFVTNTDQKFNWNQNHKYRFKQGQQGQGQVQAQENPSTLSEALIYLIDTDRFVKATTNNPSSSRSHSILYLTLKKTADDTKPIRIVLCDLAGIENKFDCTNKNIVSAFLNIKRQNSDVPYYLSETGNDGRVTDTDPVEDSVSNVPVSVSVPVPVPEEEGSEGNGSEVEPEEEGSEGEPEGEPEEASAQQNLDTHLAYLNEPLFDFEEQQKNFKTVTNNYQTNQKLIDNLFETKNLNLFFNQYKNDNSDDYDGFVNDENNTVYYDKLEPSCYYTYLLIQHVLGEYYPETISNTVNNEKVYSILQTQKELKDKAIYTYLNKFTNDLGNIIEKLKEILINFILYDEYNVRGKGIGVKDAYIKELKTILTKQQTVSLDTKPSTSANVHENHLLVEKYRNLNIKSNEKDSYKKLNDHLNNVKDVGIRNEQLLREIKFISNWNTYKDNLEAYFKPKGGLNVLLELIDKYISLIKDYIRVDTAKKEYISEEIFKIENEPREIFRVPSDDLPWPERLNLSFKEIINMHYKEFFNIIGDEQNNYLIMLFKTIKFNKQKKNYSDSIIPEGSLYDDMKENFRKAIIERKPNIEQTIKLILFVYKNVKKILTETREKILYGTKICEHRALEGQYINDSLSKIRETIRQMLIVKSEDVMFNSPNFIDICLDTYCPTHKDCFPLNTNTNVGNIPSEIFASIYKNLGYETSKIPNLPVAKTEQNKLRIQKFYQDIVVSVFCFLNLSMNSNDPPEVPYIDINLLKKKWNEDLDIKPQLSAVFKDVTDQGRFANKFVMEKTLETDLKNIITKSNVVRNELNLQNKKFVDDFIKLIDTNNSASAVGTLEFIDNISKFNSTNNICFAEGNDVLSKDQIKNYELTYGFKCLGEYGELTECE